MTDVIPHSLSPESQDGLLPPQGPFDHEVFEEHVLIERFGITVGVENVVGEEDSERIWVAYQDGYKDLNAKSLSRQNLHKDEFMEEMSDPSIIKYVARDEVGNPIGFMGVEKGLYRETSEFWDQQDDRLLDLVQSSADPNAPSFYISTFLIDRNARVDLVKTSEIILQGALLHFEEVCQALGTFSYCYFDFAPKNDWLPQSIMDTGHAKDNFKGAEVNIWPVYTQEWYRIPIEDITPENLSKWAQNLPQDVYGDQIGPEFEEGIPLKIQPENLEGDPDEYCYVSDLASITDEDSEERITNLFSGDTSWLAGKKYALVDVKRLADGWDKPHQPLVIGERLSEQTYAAMELVNDPRAEAA